MNTMATGNFRNLVPLVYQGKDLLVAGCQVNPVVLGIRDDGPALLDGEFIRDDKAALLQKLPANNEELGETPLTGKTLKTFLQQMRPVNIMLTSLFVLSFSLCCVGAYAWQQKHQLGQLEAELQLLQAAAEEK